MIFEEAQQLVPEVLTKRTLADGLVSEEFIGTLGGYGLSLIFVSAQPGLLSRAIITGCHTKVVLSLQGREASLLADTLGVAPREVERLQAGECLVRASGRGVVKVTAQTLHEVEGKLRRMIAFLHSVQAPPLLQRARAAYQVLPDLTPEYYGTLVEVIEDTMGGNPPPSVHVELETSLSSVHDISEVEEKADSEELECWAAGECGLCAVNRRIAQTGINYAEKYWKQTKKDIILTKLKHYPRNPTILYDSLLELITKAEEPGAELLAFCGHWALLEWCANHPTLGPQAEQVFILGREQLVARLVGEPEISRILDRSRKLTGGKFGTGPRFSPWDTFCTICPLEQGLRESFCLKYREEANLVLEDTDRWQRLTAAYQSSFRRLLEVCFAPIVEGTSANPSTCYCLATTFLKGEIGLTKAQRAVLLDQTQQFLTEYGSRPQMAAVSGQQPAHLLGGRQGMESTPSAEDSVKEADPTPPPPLARQESSSEDERGKGGDRLILEAYFEEHRGIVPLRKLDQTLREAGAWQSKARFYALLKEIGVISFIGRIGTGASRQTYIVHPSPFQHLAVPWKFYTPKHVYTMRQIKNAFVGAILEDVARRTVTDPDGRQRQVISDLWAKLGARVTIIEYTAGGRQKLRELIDKAAGSPYQKYAIVVDWKTRPKPPYQEQLRYGLRFKGQSNLQDAQELWFEAGEPANIQFFTTDQLDLLRAWCMTHELPHRHHTR